jgi:hypothetical protein
MRKWELDSLQLKRVQLDDIGQDQTIDRTSVTEIMDVIQIIEICEAIENSGDIIVDIKDNGSGIKIWKLH